MAAEVGPAPPVPNLASVYETAPALAAGNLVTQTNGLATKGTYPVGEPSGGHLLGEHTAQHRVVGVFWRQHVETPPCRLRRVISS